MFFSLSSPLASKALLPQPPSPPLLPFNPFLPPLRRPCLRLQTPRVLPRAAASPAEDAALPKSAIRRIAEKLRTLGYLEEEERQEGGRASDAEEARGSAGEIFIPVPRELPKRRVGHTLDPSWSTPERPVPVPGSGTAIVRFHELRREAGRQRRDAPVEKEETPMVAELVIPADELRRLRGLGIRLNKRMKIGKAGITEGIVNGIHERWRHSELVKIKCEDLCRLNMKRTHEILERKTGGLVIWRSGSIIILYRGINYKYPYFTDNYSDENLEASSEPSVEKLTSGQEGSQLSIADTNFIKSTRDRHPSHGSLVIGVGSPKKVRFQLPGESQLEEEADQLLDGLGPRFTDWWGYDPLPVDADLLPAVVPSLRRPFRLLPFGVQPKLTDREMTILRRLSRPLPCHFALGRNRNLQGLAASIIKLWEKCEIAKIAVKRGVQNTNSELMAEELKRLTGGTLLSRDKDFIVFYRGKDFLPLAVSNAVAERRNHVMHKEKLGVGITESSSTIPVSDSESPVESVTSVQPQQTNTQKKSLSTEGKWSSTKAAVQSIDDRLSKAIDKKMKAEKLLKELEEPAVSHKPEMDKEAISEEERYMLRKVGLRMKPFLLLGRRGAFDGTVENMHLHWKYRELVKIISRNRPVEETYATARTLEAASGGILVAVERVNKGYAIIVYRGKNYRRPTNLRPQTLLNKKEAFNHYLENQRRESLKLHVLKLSQDIELMKQKRVNRDKEVDRMQSAASNESDIISQALDSSISLQTDDQSSIQSMGMDEFPTAEMENDIISVYANENPPALSFTEHEEKMDGKNVKKLPEMETMQLYSEHVFKTNEQDNDETSAADLEKGNFSIDAEGPILKSAEHKDMLNIEHEHGFSKAETTQSFCDPRSEANITDTEENAKKEACPGVQTSFKAAPLSNKERLILRKQALSMKYRPVLAVGRNNVVTGVAKTIKVHFRKHPLAIVNIKGIAKGTSVREVIFELERATGAVLVSREPSKIILYRGWGEREESRSAKKKKLGKEPTPSTDVKEIPSKLMNAIRVESGLQLSEEVLHEEEVTPSSENSEP